VPIVSLSKRTVYKGFMQRTCDACFSARNGSLRLNSLRLKSRD
jgi:hypothetical protein